MRTTMFNGYHKSVYENYMNEMEGEYSIEKKEYINSYNFHTQTYDCLLYTSRCV